MIYWLRGTGGRKHVGSHTHTDLWTCTRFVYQVGFQVAENTQTHHWSKENAKFPTGQELCVSFSY